MSASSYLAMEMAGPGLPPAPVERIMPHPAPREAVVRVHASSMNFHDAVNLMGLLDGPWPRVPMSDGAGDVVSIGSQVTNVGVGDRVIGAFHPGWVDGRPTRENKREMPGDSRDGWLQQYQLFPAEALIHVPGYLTDSEAATLPCAGTTAWSALEIGHVGAGDIVVTQGTGGVSLYALQLAKARGATVILTSSSDEKLEVGHTLGADLLINYRTTPDWEIEVRRLTDGRGADLVVDLGGQDTLGRSVKATRVDGAVAIVGVLSGFGMASISVSDAMMHNIHLSGITVGSIRAHADLCAAMERAEIHPHISHRLPWDEMSEATTIMQTAQHIGKIVIDIP
jgi:NADPH:quinone reductase-like Zn-dependent oxidoreductase